MHLIVGLGNPGPEYSLTRHNIGFMTIDGLAQAFSGSFKSEKKALTTKIRIGSTPVMLAKPQTYMNLSGESVRALVDYYDVGLDELLVIHDEKDLPFGAIRYQHDRGHGGHNGIRSIHQQLSSTAYARLRLGVGSPTNSKQDVADFVLSNFSKSEQAEIADYLSDACDSVLCFVEKGWQEAATRFNRTDLTEPK